MKKITFLMICDKLKPFLQGGSCNSTKLNEYSIERKVAITIYKLASCCEYRVAGDVFGVHKSTVHKYFYEVVRAINCLKSKYISFPKLDEALAIAEGFKLVSKMEQVIGAIDGNSTTNSYYILKLNIIPDNLYFRYPYSSSTTQRRT